MDGEKTELTEGDAAILATVSQLLGLDGDDVRLVLLNRQINVRGNITEIPLKPHEVGCADDRP